MEKVRCPICGKKKYYSLVRDDKGNKMCIDCYAKMYGKKPKTIEYVVNIDKPTITSTYD